MIHGLVRIRAYLMPPTSSKPSHLSCHNFVILSLCPHRSAPVTVSEALDARLPPTNDSCGAFPDLANGAASGHDAHTSPGAVRLLSCNAGFQLNEWVDGVASSVICVCPRMLLLGEKSILSHPLSPPRWANHYVDISGGLPDHRRR